jgi:hypothetical protein
MRIWIELSRKKFVCLFVYSHTSSFSAIWWLSPLPVTGLQILAYARRSGPLSREGSLSCHTYCDTGPRFIRSHPKDRHPRPTLGFEPPTQGSSGLCAWRSNHCATRAVIWVKFLEGFSPSYLAVSFEEFDSIYGSLLWFLLTLSQFSLFFRISNSFGLSITKET